MDIAALALEVFGVGSLCVAFVKYTLEKKKTLNAEGNMKNHGSNHSLTCRRI